VDADVGRDYLSFGFENLEQPGFSEEFPKQFTASGEVSTLSPGSGALAGGMGLWHVTTGPDTVRELLSVAARTRDPCAFLKVHRRLVYGRGLGDSPY
jgi:hypothetical protein